jgi:hypothetical protein
MTDECARAGVQHRDAEPSAAFGLERYEIGAQRVQRSGRRLCVSQGDAKTATDCAGRDADRSLPSRVHPIPPLS